MSTVVDTSGLVALLRAEPAGAEVQDLITSGPVRASTATLTELTDQLERRLGLTTDAARSMIGDLRAGGLVAVDVNPEIAMRAGSLRAAHHHRSSCPISVVDCIVVATVEREGAVLVSSDANQCLVAARLGLPINPIPNSSGVRPPG